MNNIPNYSAPEVFIAAGVSLPVNGSDLYRSDRREWERRIKDGLPYRAPRFSVGDWIYHPFTRENVKVLKVVWDIPSHGGGGWRTSVPGYTAIDDNMQAEASTARRAEYRESSPGSWERAHV